MYYKIYTMISIYDLRITYIPKKGAVALADFNQLMAAPFDYHIAKNFLLNIGFLKMKSINKPPII